MYIQKLDIYPSIYIYSYRYVSVYIYLNNQIIKQQNQKINSINREKAKKKPRKSQEKARKKNEETKAFEVPIQFYNPYQALPTSISRTCASAEMFASIIAPDPCPRDFLTAWLFRLLKKIIM